MTTRTLARIDETLDTLEEGSLRYQVLDCAKRFKTTWMELGQALVSVKRDRHFKEWGYLTFEAYCVKEIGIKKPTAQKLLMSYTFLEQEEPVYLRQQTSAPEKGAKIPDYESVNVLRLLRSKKDLPAEDYQIIRADVLEKGKEAAEVRKDVRALMKQIAPVDPEEERQKRRSAVLKRLVTSMKSVKQEIEVAKMLPAALLKEIEALAAKLEAQIG
ncbi:MAG: hypothetical protein JW937_03340 [Candidatus Omnitrophica bacterium]|nr:hypothetical protein [Candidatus Omnitrophota bacterium]